MTKSATVSAYVWGAIMIAGGLGHFISPEFYNAFLPDMLPKLAVNIAAGAVELLLGIGCLMPRFRTTALRFTGLLMVGFVLVHTIDLFQDEPAIGSRLAATFRLPAQWALTWWCWWTWRKHRDADFVADQQA